MTMLWKRTFLTIFCSVFVEPGPPGLKERLLLTFSSFIRASHLIGSFQILKLISLRTFGVEKMPNICMEIPANIPTKSMKAKKSCQMSSKLENSILTWMTWPSGGLHVYTPSNSQPFFMWYSCLLLFFFLGLATKKQWPAFMLCREGVVLGYTSAQHRLMSRASVCSQLLPSNLLHNLTT